MTGVRPADDAKRVRDVLLFHCWGFAFELPRWILLKDLLLMSDG